MRDYRKIAIDYATDVVNGKINAGIDRINGCKRFLSDLEREDLELNDRAAGFVLGIIERLMVHKQGETIDGEPLTNKPFILLPWQVFVSYNITAFYYKGTKERRFKEAFIFVPRKTGKTLLIAALSFGLALKERKSGSKVYIVAASQDQACEAFDDILYTLRYRQMIDEFRVRDNNAEHSISCEFTDDNERPDGSIEIRALASNPDVHDSFNCNIAIADEVHAFRKPAQYNRFKEAMSAYLNRLMVGITTAGDNVNSFGYRRLEYAKKVLSGQVQDDSFFTFVCQADQDKNGECDYTDPTQHEKANPSYGVAVRPQDMTRAALQAQNDPQQRKDFLSRSLNIYTSAVRAYFDIEKFKASDRKYNWTMDQLTKLPIRWYGGADLSRLHDLTATALYGSYGDVDIVITHAFFPVSEAVHKAEEDNIPLFGWRDDGWLTMTNGQTTNMADVVKWFICMREKGFDIAAVGHDRKFAGEEYFPAMKKAGFQVIDQPQYFYVKSNGFRHIERKARNGELYYLHSQAYEYCVANVTAVEKTDDAVDYAKIEYTQRIDLFDASVFACVQAIKRDEKEKEAQEWWSEGEGEDDE